MRFSVGTFLTVLFDILIDFFGIDFERNNGKFTSEHNFHFKNDH